MAEMPTITQEQLDALEHAWLDGRLHEASDADQAAWLQDMLHAITVKERASLKAKLQAIALAEGPTNSKSLFASVHRYYVAAVLLIGVALSILLFLPKQDVASGTEMAAELPADNDLFSKYYRPYGVRDVPQTAQRETPENLLLQDTQTAARNAQEMASTIEMEGLSDYQDGRYADASQKLEAVLTAKPKEPESLFYAGIAHLAEGQLDSSIMRLEEAIGGEQPTDTPVKQAASWYLSLAYLKAGNTEQAKNSLQQVANSDSPYSAQANQLLQELD